MTTPTVSNRRSRPAYAVALFLVVGLGLLLRSGAVALPGFLVKYGGDSLWALAVFLGFGIVVPSRSTIRTASFALLFAWSVEFLQLYHAEAIDGIRSTRLGRLVLGTTFNAPDLLAYLAGIACGAWGERLVGGRRRKAGKGSGSRGREDDGAAGSTGGGNGGQVRDRVG